jgi:hypothetical protein
MNTSVKNMMIYSSKWNEKATFRMMPIDKDCPYNEAIFDPEQKVLAVVSKDNKDKPMMMPRLNDRGDLIPAKRANGEQGWQEQRVVLAAYYEYYLEDINDIVAFVKRFAINDDSKVFTDAIHSAVNDETLHTAYDLEVVEEQKKSKKSK